MSNLHFNHEYKIKWPTFFTDDTKLEKSLLKRTGLDLF